MTGQPERNEETAPPSVRPLFVGWLVLLAIGLAYIIVLGLLHR